MRIRADFHQRVTVTPDQHVWQPSPQAGVERVMLDRIGAEQARATSLVRYAPQSTFPPHQHPLGEEILVLEGTLSEAGQDYGAGWYLRNPPGSAHQPSSLDGALLFVKLRQMSATETQPVRINTRPAEHWRAGTNRRVCPLFASAGEQVSVQELEAGAVLFPDPIPGAEWLLLHGTLTEGESCYRQGSWMRLPAGHYPGLRAGSDGARCYVKVGALPVGEAPVHG